MSRDCTVQVAGERLVLMPERALSWPARRTLLVADTHWGKAATFRSAGVFVPGGTTLGGLDRLSGAIRRAGAERVVFLGDFLHARQGRVPATLGALARWREAHPALQLVLVRGNHDRHSGDPPAELGIRCEEPPLVEGPFVLAHHPGTSGLGYVLAGHLHPAVRLSGPGRQRERLPCFVFGPGGAILPAFGDFTGAAEVVPEPGDRVYLVAEDAVLPVR